MENPGWQPELVAWQPDQQLVAVVADPAALTALDPVGIVVVPAPAPQASVVVPAPAPQTGVIAYMRPPEQLEYINTGSTAIQQMPVPTGCQKGGGQPAMNGHVTNGHNGPALNGHAVHNGPGSYSPVQTYSPTQQPVTTVTAVTPTTVMTPGIVTPNGAVNGTIMNGVNGCVPVSVIPNGCINGTVVTNGLNGTVVNGLNGLVNAGIVNAVPWQPVDMNQLTAQNKMMCSIYIDPTGQQVQQPQVQPSQQPVYVDPQQQQGKQKQVAQHLATAR